MSLSKKRKARKNTRVTLSGKVLPIDAPVRPSWVELVQPQPETTRTVRTGSFYLADDKIPLPEELHVVEHEFTGSNRAQRRHRIKSARGAMLGSYTRQTHLMLGEAWSQAREARRLMRERAKSAQVAARYEALSAESA